MFQLIFVGKRSQPGISIAYLRASKQEQALNRGPTIKREYMIAEVSNEKIVNFHDYQSILEIFDDDEVIISDEGLYHDNSFWIYENFIDLDMVDEIWAPVNVGGNIIQVSNMVRVQIKRKTTGSSGESIIVGGNIITILKTKQARPNRKRFGYTLASGYKSTSIGGSPFLVHRLVVIAFRGIYDDKLQINHMDKDRANNRLDNLEIITASANVIHAVENGAKTVKSVQQSSLDGTIITIFSSIQKASNATNIGHSSIGKAANGKQKTAGIEPRKSIAFSRVLI